MTSCNCCVMCCACCSTSAFHGRAWSWAIWSERPGTWWYVLALCWGLPWCGSHPCRTEAVHWSWTAATWWSSWIVARSKSCKMLDHVHLCCHACGTATWSMQCARSPVKSVHVPLGLDEQHWSPASRAWTLQGIVSAGLCLLMWWIPLVIQWCRLGSTNI